MFCNLKNKIIELNLIESVDYSIVFILLLFIRHYSRSARQHFQLIEENYKKFNIEDGQMNNKPILVMDAPLRLA